MTKSAMSKVKPFKFKKLYLHQITYIPLANQWYVDLSASEYPIHINFYVDKEDKQTVQVKAEQIAASFGAELVDIREK